MRSRRRTGAVSLAAALTATLTLGMASNVQGAPGTAAAGNGEHGPSAHEVRKAVTLITGDKVYVDGRSRVVRVQPGAGRAGTAISVKRFRGHSYAIPMDAAKLLAQGKLDRRLFDVTELIESRYDDAHRDDVPLIVAYTKQKSQARANAKARAKADLAAADVDVRHGLPAVNGDAVTAPKSGASRVWDALTGTSARQGSRQGPRTSAPGVAKVWLDGLRTASLDQSVPQIGAPDAWAAGFDGTGVKVAVLDTGVDQTHPDLADREVGEKNFSDAADSVDRFGHGTHVASIVAGSAAKSNGKYKGVAPGAKILDGKVLNDEGFGEDSWIIAGMQWAADQGAKVVNLSLGGGDTPEVDPIEAAVDTLSTGKGVLFAIAAGNEGPGSGSVGSPGSAEKALTVGAVDKKDKLADFSSVGPTADGSLKPDITAPGVDIVAAKAAHGQIGDPAAPGYVSLSGTSMATPHVAGAAAILAQQHPDWTGQQIKAALTASAKPAAGLSAYQQGSGRTDVRKAIKQSVVSEPSSVGFGVQLWPHGDDQPVTKQVSYRNSGSQAVTLDLSVEATGPDGSPAPAGLLTAEPARVTVPAGGTADVAVTADTRIGSLDGAYSGALVATAGERSVRTAVAVLREVESYDLTMKFLDNHGQPAQSFTTIVGSDTFAFPEDPDGDGTARIRLPKGNYVLEAPVLTPRGEDDADVSLLVRPKLSLTRTTELTLDGRTAKPVSITPPDTRAKGQAGYLTYDVTGEDYGIGSTWFLDGFAGFTTRHVGPALPAEQFTARIGGAWTATGSRYDLVWGRAKTFFTGFTHRTDRRELARVSLTAGVPATGKKAVVGVTWLDPAGSGIGVGLGGSTLPLKLREYVRADRALTWGFDLTQTDSEGNAEAVQAGRPGRYQAQRTYSRRFNVGVFGPSVGRASDGSGAWRYGNALDLCVAMFTDRFGNFGSSVLSKAATTLTADGEKLLDVKEEPCRPVSGLPAASAKYKLATDLSRSGKVSKVSTRVAAVWTFTSAKPSGEEGVKLPLSTVRFTPRLSLASAAKAGRKLTVPLVIEGPAAGRGLKDLAVKVSYDGGGTWKKAAVTTVQGRKYVKLSHPKTAKSVSFKVVLRDRKGNTASQTIIGAYRLVR